MHAFPVQLSSTSVGLSLLWGWLGVQAITYGTFVVIWVFNSTALYKES